MEQAEFDKRVADLVAHRTPDELARDYIRLKEAHEAMSAPPAAEPLQDEGDDALDADPRTEDDLADKDDDDDDFEDPNP